MSSSRNLTQHPLLPVAVITATLLCFAVGLLVLTWRLRTDLREAALAREADILHSVTVMLQREAMDDLPRELWNEPSTQLGVLLKASRLKGVLTARLFDPGGKLVLTVPDLAAEGALATGDFARLAGHATVARFHAGMPRDRLLLAGTAPHPAGPFARVLEVIVPLHRQDATNLLGAAQYFIDGEPMAAEMARLDASLVRQTAGAFLLGGALIAGTLHQVFRRLRYAQRQIALRTRSLLDANRELALAGKTSAIGTLTTHLLHELKSHLFGLQALADSRAVKDTPAGRAVLESSRHMQSMVLRLLDAVKRESSAPADYEISFREFADAVARQVEPVRAATRVRLEFDLPPAGTISHRVAQLAEIIAMHLVQNALQATPAGRRVTLSLNESPAHLRLTVRDEGRGFPGALRPWLFKPCASTKEGGTGLGLALCAQLAAHLEAQLTLESSTTSGCVFALALPAAAKSPDAELELTNTSD